MSDVTLILSQIEAGDRSAAEQLLPLVYDELRKLAAVRMKNERPDHTLQATALVHEAYMRLVGTPQSWETRGHFFAAAAEAMRRILVDNARAKMRKKRSGNAKRMDVDVLDAADPANLELILSIHEALEQLAAEDDRLATLVKLRCFAGFSLQEAAESLGIARSTAYDDWTYAKSRLRIILDDQA